MTEENEQIYNDMKKYEHGLLLGRLIQDKMSQYLPGAFGAMGKRWGLKGDELDGLIAAALNSGEGTKIAVGTYLKKYWDAASKLSLKGFCEYHKDIISKYLGERTKDLFEKISGYTDENIGKIREKFAKLSHGVDSPDSKESEKAKKELKGYEDVQKVLQVIEEEKYSKLLPEVIQYTNRITLESILEAA